MPEVLDAPASPLTEHRRRLRASGFQRIEVAVHRDDAALVRAVAAALADPVRAEAARTLLRSRFAAAPGRGLKALLERAPLEDVELDRPSAPGRDVEL